MSAQKSTLSVIVITKDEEANIQECLASVQWADEIIVVDSGSTDKTVQYAHKHTKKVYKKEWEGFGATKAFALSKAKCEWVFSLDADERVTPELADEIRSVVQHNVASHTGFSVPRKAFFLGKWIKHCGWYPGRVVRLFRRKHGRFTPSQVHEAIAVNGTIGVLRSDLLHYTDPSLQHYFQKFNRYTTLAAEDLLSKGERFSFDKMLFRPFWTFLRMYILRRGFLDGVEGFMLCVLSSCYVFTKYAKLRELRRKQKAK
ncbi:MAG: glycosyltransferase family 2 protein [Ignavibacteriae bacterium]|nr:glycosyltransferase family 2 protein [Ignavibacteriota bacterium]